MTEIDYEDVAREVIAAFEAWLRSNRRRFPARSMAWRYRRRPEFLAALRRQLRKATGFDTDEDFEMLLAALAINKRPPESVGVSPGVGASNLSLVTSCDLAEQMSAAIEGSDT